MSSPIIDAFQAGNLKIIQQILGEVNEPVYKVCTTVVPAFSKGAGPSANASQSFST